MTPLEQLKLNLREAAHPFFEKEELSALLEQAGGDVREASYLGLLRKAEEDAASLPNMSLASTRAYWLSLARLYRPNASGIVRRRDAV